LVITDFQPLALQPLCGYVLDVIGLKRGYALLVVAWSLISMGHGLAHNWHSMLALFRRRNGKLFAKPLNEGR
jgi:hypothetical protein